MSRDKRLPFDTWNTSFLLNRNLIRPKIIIKEFTTVGHQQRKDQFHKRWGQGPLSQEMRSEMGAQFHCRHLQESRRPRVHSYRWIFRTILWLGSKNSKYRNCNSTNSLIHHRSWCGRQDSKHTSRVVLIFRRKLCFGSKKWRWSIHWMNKNPRDQLLERIFKILRCWTRRLLPL